MSNQHQKLVVEPENPELSLAGCCYVQPPNLYCLRSMLHICSNLMRRSQSLNYMH